MNELVLHRRGNVQLTQEGYLYEGQLHGTLHHIKQYECELIGGRVMTLNYEEYMLISRAMDDPNIRSVRLRGGVILAINQIKIVTPRTITIDTRKETIQ